MPTRIDPGVPSVPISFSNCFWGANDDGVQTLHDRMRVAKQTCEELKTFYRERALIEEEYAKKLVKLSKTALGANEIGGLRVSLDTMKKEVEGVATSHSAFAGQIRGDIEEGLAIFGQQYRDRKKAVQNTIEKLHRTKLQQEQQAAKHKEKYESDCVKINGYIAQQNMLMGKELEKNNLKLEKVQTGVQASNKEYQNAIRMLTETTERWNREWKIACDKYQDLEEERFDFMKANMWSFANLMSTVCVSDDESCEKIRVALEKCEVEKDIQAFIREYGTGQEIPEPPKYRNFYGQQGEDTGYTVAQFQRSQNPQYTSNGTVIDDVDDEYDEERNGRMKQSASASSRLSMPPIKGINEYPPDGMTQFCRSDSTFLSPRLKAPDSPTASSVYSSNVHDRGSNNSIVSAIPRVPSMKDSSYREDAVLHDESLEDTSPTKQTISKARSFFNFHKKAPSKSAPVSPIKSSTSMPASNVDTNASHYHSSSRHYEEPMHVSSSSANLGYPREPQSTATSPKRSSRIDLDSYGRYNEPEPTGYDRYSPTHSSSHHREPDRRKSLYLDDYATKPEAPTSRRSSPTKQNAQPFTDEIDPIVAALQNLQAQPSARLPKRTDTGQFSSASLSSTPSQVGHSFNPSSNGPRSPAQVPRRPDSRDLVRSNTEPRNHDYLNNRPSTSATSYSDQSRGSHQPRARLRSQGSKRDAMLGDFERQPEARYNQQQIAHSTSADSFQRENNDSSRAMDYPSRFEDADEPRQYYRSLSRGSMSRDFSQGHPQQNERKDIRRTESAGQRAADYESMSDSKRVRSKSMGDSRRKVSGYRDPLFYAKALYDYDAAIAEEVDFRKGEVVAVLRTQKDGWWFGDFEASESVRRGLVPSNFFQVIRD